MWTFLQYTDTAPLPFCSRTKLICIICDTRRWISIAKTIIHAHEISQCSQETSDLKYPFSLPNTVPKTQWPLHMQCSEHRLNHHHFCKLQRSWQFLFTFYSKTTCCSLTLQGKAGRAPSALEGYSDTWMKLDGRKGGWLPLFLPVSVFWVL